MAERTPDASTNPTQPVNFGRRATDFLQKDDRLTFGKYVDKLFPIAITTLLGWLCISTMDLRKDMALVVERTNNQSKQFEIIHAELERLTGTDRSHEKALNKLAVEAARHGWKASSED